MVSELQAKKRNKTAIAVPKDQNFSRRNAEVKRKNTFPLPMVHRATPASCSGESRRGRPEEGEFQRENNAIEGSKIATVTAE